MLCKFLDGCEAPLLLSMEEGLSDSLITRLKRLEIHSDAFKVAVADTIDEIADLVERHQPSALGIDSLSVTTLKIGDVMRLSNAVGVPVVFVLHSTKGGEAAGAAGVLHAVDVVVEVSALKWAVRKSRFTGLIGGEV
jgi:predicted ATP-dependent serine protease